MLRLDLGTAVSHGDLRLVPWAGSCAHHRLWTGAVWDGARWVRAEGTWHHRALDCCPRNQSLWSPPAQHCPLSWRSEGSDSLRQGRGLLVRWLGKGWLLWERSQVGWLWQHLEMVERLGKARRLTPSWCGRADASVSPDDELAGLRTKIWLLEVRAGHPPFVQNFVLL